MPDIDPEIPDNAVRVYGQSEAADDFPVLKAFQQYIDAEQAKARKRMVMLSVFFGILMIAVIAVFLMLLMNISSRNQSLNDRLIEYAMKDRDRQQSPVVVNPPQDNSAILALTAKMDELQQKLSKSESEAKAAREAKEQAEKAAREKAEKEAAAAAAAEAAKPKGPTPEQLEIERLKSLLAKEKEKEKAEQDKRKQEELEAYRRKHYPELYEKPKPQPVPIRPRKMRNLEDELDDDLEDEEDGLNDDEAIDYFDKDDEDEEEVKPVRKTRKSPSKSKSSAKRTKSAPKAKVEPAGKAEKQYSIPVEVRKSSKGWRIPTE